MQAKIGSNTIFCCASPTSPTPPRRINTTIREDHGFKSEILRINATPLFKNQGKGNGSNQVGRFVRVEDASGSQELHYGRLGETVKEIRTIASHTQGASKNSPEVYTTTYRYDSFGRLVGQDELELEVLEGAGTRACARQRIQATAGGVVGVVRLDAVAKHEPGALLELVVMDEVEVRGAHARFVAGKAREAATGVVDVGDGLAAFQEYLPAKGQQRGLPGMGGIYNPLNLGSYTYAHLQPLKISDPDGRIAIADDVVIGAGIVIVAGAVYVSDPNNRKAMARAAEQGVENFKSNVQWLGEKIENLVFNEDSSGQSQAEKQKPREVGKNEELPKQGLVSGGVEGAPPVDAGKQGKHVPGHNN